MANLSLISEPNLTMSSLEIAELCGTRHNVVLATIRRLLKRNLLQLNCKSPRTVASRGRTKKVYDLNRRDSLLVVSGYKDEVRAALIDRWDELENQELQPAQLPLPVFPQAINDYIDLTVSRIVKDAERASEEHLRSMAQERLKLHTEEQTIEWLKEFQEKGARPLILVKEDVNLLSVLLNLVEVNARKTLDKINSHII